jgi:hypothetical protein
MKSNQHTNTEASAVKVTRRINPLSISKRYVKNEDCNAHSENVILLAEAFGTKEDVQIAHHILELHHELNHMPYPLARIRSVIHNRLYPIMIRACKRKEDEMMEKVK